MCTCTTIRLSSIPSMSVDMTAEVDCLQVLWFKCNPKPHGWLLPEFRPPSLNSYSHTSKALSMERSRGCVKRPLPGYIHIHLKGKFVPNPRALCEIEQGKPLFDEQLSSSPWHFKVFKVRVKWKRYIFAVPVPPRSSVSQNLPFSLPCRPSCYL